MSKNLGRVRAEVYCYDCRGRLLHSQPLIAADRTFRADKSPQSRDIALGDLHPQARSYFNVA